MADFTRFRVRGPNKKFNDPGPDLLRTVDNARAAASSVMAGQHDGWTFHEINQGGHTAESSVIGKHYAVQALDNWMRRGRGSEFVLSHKGTAEVFVRRENVKWIATASCSPATVELRSLIEHQFPKILFAGGYVWKQIAGSSSWSDHAWGTAIDETQNPPNPTNDETLDWLSRMGKAGCAKFDYALGSRNGSVVQCGAPDYDVVSSGADTSHLWHCHISVVDHNGQKPPREGGVW